MDFTEQNLRTIGSIQLHNMTVEEAVEADRRVESHFHRSDGIWWREVKPFFYQPAALMRRVIPHEAAPRPWLALGGYYHMVPDGSASNGVIVVNEVTEPAAYDLEQLPKKTRYDLRRGLAQLRVGRVSNLEHLLGDGYNIYLAWEQRVGNVFVRRSDPAVYRRWIERSFHHPYSLILGAYLENRLVAYVLANAVDGTADLSKSFSDPLVQQQLHVSPSSALIFAYVRICGRNPQIRKVCCGLRSHKYSLEDYKQRLGFRHVAYPSFIHLRAPIRPFVRWLMPIQYQRLMGHYDPDASSLAAT